MKQKRLHWLEIAEYTAYGLTFLSLLGAIASQALLLPLLGLFCTLFLGLINRLRNQYIQRQRLAALAKQTPWLSSLKILENSLNSLIEYVNHLPLSEQSRNQIPPVNLSPLPELSLIPLPQGKWKKLYSLLQAHSQALSALALSPDERFLASVSWDRSLKIWHLGQGVEITRSLAHDQGILALAFWQEQENYYLATGGFDQQVKIWHFTPQTPNLELGPILSKHTGSIHALAYLGGDRLVSASYDQTLQQWDSQKNLPLWHTSDHRGAIYAIAVHPQNSWIATAGGDGTISLWSSYDGTKVGSLSGNVSSVASLTISPHGQTLAAGCVDGSIKVWSLPPAPLAPPLRSFVAHRGQVNALQFSHDSQLLWSGGADGLVKTWHPQAQEAIAHISLEPQAITALQLTSGDRYLLVGAADGSLHLWQQVA
jgi:WD40 repeat protein